MFSISDSAVRPERKREYTPLNYFGLSTFFTGDHRKYSVRSLSFSKLFTLNRDDFLNILQKGDRMDWESFHLIKDNILLYNTRLHDLNESCEACHDAGHSIFNCPYMGLRPNKELIILKHLYSKDQERFKWKRIPRKSHNAWNLFDKWNKEIRINGMDEKKSSLFRNFGTEITENDESEQDEKEEPSDFSKQHRSLVLASKSSDCLIKRSASNKLESESVGQDAPGFSPDYVRNLGGIIKSPGMETTATREDEKAGRNLGRKKGGFGSPARNTSSTSTDPKTVFATNENSSNDKNDRNETYYSVAPTETINDIEDESEKKGQKMLFDDFDRMQNFQIYFPHNNAKTVVKYFSTRFKTKKKKVKKHRMNSITATRMNRSNKVDALIDLDEQRKFYIKEQKGASSMNLQRSPRKKKRSSFKVDL